MTAGQVQLANDPARVELADVGLVIAAAGSGRRFGGTTNKLLTTLDGIPVIAHSLRRFVPLLPSGHVVLVVSQTDRESFLDLLREEGWDGAVTVVVGGAERQDSVLAGLEALPEAAALAAIHDAARPRASLTLLVKCVRSARSCGSGVAAVRMKDTVKRVRADDRVVETLERDQLCATETPQVFRRDLIEQAYREANNAGVKVTDDAQVMERIGLEVQLVVHADDNRKITLPSDLA